MTAHIVETETAWAVIDRPYSWIILNSKTSGCLKVHDARLATVATFIEGVNELELRNIPLLCEEGKTRHK